MRLWGSVLKLQDHPFSRLLVLYMQRAIMTNATCDLGDESGKDPMKPITESGAAVSEVVTM